MAAPPVPNWQAQILRGIGAPVTPQNLLYLNDWARAEGGSAANNPFNTTQGAPGASSYNSVGVRNYGSPEQGIHATVQTLENGRYQPIIAALRQGTDARASARALAGSPWGTGSLVLKMLGAGGGGGAPEAIPPGPGGGAVPHQVAPHPVGTSPIVSALKLLGFNAPAGLGRAPAVPQTPAIPPQAPLPAGGAGGIAELLQEGTGGPTHSTGPHVHAAFTNPQLELAAIKEAEALGLHVGENPYVGSMPAPGVHARNSYHYRDFPGSYNGRKLGEAIDVSGGNTQPFYAWLAARKGR